MALSDHNKFTCIGRLAREPELRQFGGGGSVANFSLAFTGQSRKQGDEWIDEPCFLECKAFDPAGGKGRKLATTVMNYTTKGSRVFIEGRLILERWDDKQTGQKRQAHKLLVDTIILLEKKGDGPARDNGNAQRSVNSGADDEYGGEIPF